MIKILKMINRQWIDNNNFDNDNDDKDDEYNDVNEHLVKLDGDKTDQSNEVNDNKPDFWSHKDKGKGRTNFSGGDSGIQDFDHRSLDHLLKDLFCITYLFTGAHFCGCIHGHNLVTLGLPWSHPGEKNGIT